MTEFLDDFLWESMFLPAGSAVKSLEATLWQYSQLEDDDEQESPFEEMTDEILPQEESSLDNTDNGEVSSQPLPQSKSPHTYSDGTEFHLEDVRITFGSIFERVQKDRLAWADYDNDDYDVPPWNAPSPPLLENPQEWSPQEFKVIEALSIFTAGPRAGISQIRFPGNEQSREEYDERLGEKFRGIGAHKFDFSQDTVDDARKVLTSLASAPVDSSFSDDYIYRGLRVPAQVADKFNVGDVMDMGNVSSWTIEPQIAFAYSQTTAHGSDQVPRNGVVLQMKPPKRGTYIGYVSKFVTEKEFLTGGEIRVTSRTDYPHFIKLDVEQI